MEAKEDNQAMKKALRALAWMVPFNLVMQLLLAGLLVRMFTGHHNVVFAWEERALAVVLGVVYVAANLAIARALGRASSTPD